MNKRRLPVEVLAVYEDLGKKYHIIRARTGDIIRYYRVSAETSRWWPKGWQGQSSAVLLPIPELDLSPQAAPPKCIELYYSAPPEGSGRLYEPISRTMPLARSIPVELTGVQGVDHPVKLEYTTFERVRVLDVKVAGATPGCLRERLSIVRHPALAEHGEVLMKISEFPVDALCPGAGPGLLALGSERSMGNDIAMHQEAAGRGLAPPFLGLVTERGRGVVGYCMAYWADARDLAARTARDGHALTAADKRGVRAAFGRLHAECRLFHGDCHLGNVLRRADGAVFLIDFQLAMRLNRRGHVDGREDCSAADEDYDVERWIAYAESEAAQNLARSRLGYDTPASEGETGVSEWEPETGESEWDGE